MMSEIEQEVAAMRQMSVRQVRARYVDVFGEPPRSRHRVHLVRRIAWRMQALAEGDLTERARRRAAELARDADLRLGAPREPRKNASKRPSRAAGVKSAPGGRRTHPTSAPYVRASTLDERRRRPARKVTAPPEESARRTRRSGRSIARRARARRGSSWPRAVRSPAGD